VTGGVTTVGTAASTDVVVAAWASVVAGGEVVVATVVVAVVVVAVVAPTAAIAADVPADPDNAPVAPKLFPDDAQPPAPEARTSTANGMAKLRFMTESPSRSPSACQNIPRREAAPATRHPAAMPQGPNLMTRIAEH
jgi:hypothetical protein